MIIYYFMKWYLGWMAKLYYRRVYFRGYELIPDGKPAIFASNHPAAFMEPIILGSSVRVPLSFLVLASYVKNRWLQWFFRSLKMVPIYRADISGRETIQKNESTFRYVYETLRSNAHVLIFPEASTSFIYKLRPLKKGIARMSVGFLNENPDKDLYIVPAGVNFINPGKFRSDVFIHIGTPVAVHEMHETEEAFRLNAIVKATSDGMQQVVYDIEEEGRHTTASILIEMYNNEQGGAPGVFGKIWRHNGKHVQLIKDLTTKINDLSAETFGTLEQKVLTYNNILRRKGLSDVEILKGKIPVVPLTFFTIIGFPFFLLSLCLNFFNLGAAWYLRKYRVERKEFEAPVTGAVSAITLLVYAILFIFLALFIHPGFLLLVVAVPLSLVFGVYYYDWAKLLTGFIKFNLLSSLKQNELIQLRHQILELLKN